MDGYKKRTELKKKLIMNSAFELFERYGFNRVTIDQIAHIANVSRVTIYKHFGNKENLFYEVIKHIVTNTTNEIETIINNDISFHEKIRKVLLLKIKINSLLDNNFIGLSISTDGELGNIISKELADRIDLMIQKLFDQGKKEGFISNNIDNKALNDYIKVFRVGLKVLKESKDDLLEDSNRLMKMFTIFFNGIKD